MNGLQQTRTKHRNLCERCGRAWYLKCKTCGIRFRALPNYGVTDGLKRHILCHCLIPDTPANQRAKTELEVRISPNTGTEKAAYHRLGILLRHDLVEKVEHECRRQKLRRQDRFHPRYIDDNDENVPPPPAPSCNKPIWTWGDLMVPSNTFPVDSLVTSMRG